MIRLIKTKMEVVISIDKLELLKSFEINQFDFDLIITKFIKFSDCVLENITNKINPNNFKNSVIEKIFINSVLELYVKLYYAKQNYINFFAGNDNIRENFFKFESCNEAITFLKNFSLIFELFQIYFGKTIDLINFSNEITSKYELFLSRFSDSFTFVLEKENNDIFISYFGKKNAKIIDTKNFEIDYLYTSLFKESLKTRKISCTLSNAFNNKKADIIEDESVFKKIYRQEIVKRKKDGSEYIILTFVKDYLMNLKSFMNQLSTVRLFNYSCVLLILNEVILLLEKLTADVNNDKSLDNKNILLK